ncbi:hypothetical protein UG55_103868 [Frankia sp. EI5c]|uniref:hypothetical protein n=1 Tax=Frankia sp. EI5c TaxID=683316 RepID=UPI0007C34F6F|nr:hypothetical protein [Frankia sp. EI5c]OAA23371.1 hypothetical protein UG55_103868 [Frankia sp. EI5c]
MARRRTPIVRGRAALILALIAVAAAGLTACGSKKDADRFAEKLRAHGYGKVEVSADRERKSGKTRLVAYDAHILVNTDADPQTCDVELENDVRSAKGGLLATFDVDEIRDARGARHEVEDDRSWPDNPTLTVLRAELARHSIDC